MRYYKDIEYYEKSQIKDLLLYRKVTKVSYDKLLLDNGVELEILPNEGCGGCGSGWYGITELNGCDNVITSVEFVNDGLDGLEGSEDRYSYKIYVFAENQKIKLLQVDGDDGNGYYGTGYRIRVRPC